MSTTTKTNGSRKRVRKPLSKDRKALDTLGARFFVRNLWLFLMDQDDAVEEFMKQGYSKETSRVRYLVGKRVINEDRGIDLLQLIINGDGNRRKIDAETKKTAQLLLDEV